nr:restriction system-associated AAA family ATPase [uncultured Flavobacterium sp.]
MKLLRLQINNSFRSLPAGFKLIFRDTNDLYDNLAEPICLVGVNGSGKSNVLEALGEIFSYLDQTFLKFVNKHSDSPLINSFELEYLLPLTMDMEFITVDNDITSDTEFINIKIVKANDSLPSFYWVFRGEDRPIALGMDSILPKRIIAYSSGQNELLSIPFNRIKFRYYNTLLQEQKANYREAVEYSRLRYIDYDENASILLANYLMAKNNEVDVLKEHLNILDITSFELIINRNQKKSGVLIIEKDIDKLLDFLESRSEINFEISKGIYRHCFTITTDLKEEFQNNFLDAIGLYTLFKRIGYLNLNNIEKNKIDTLLNSNGEVYDNYKITDFSSEKKLFQISEIHIKKGDLNNSISYRKLSDGEHQFIHVIGTLLMMKDETALFLFDEPETHFNPKWKYEYSEIFKKVTNSHKSQILMTTHDPVLISGLSKENVIVFNKPQAGLERTYKPDKDLKGMGVDAILTSEIFGLNSTLDSGTLNDMVELRTLLLKKQNHEINENELKHYFYLYEKLKGIDYAEPLNDPMYRDFLNAKKTLEIYSKPFLSVKEEQERTIIAAKIMSKIKEKYS